MLEYPLSSEKGTPKLVKARFWPWLGQAAPNAHLGAISRSGVLRLFSLLLWSLELSDTKVSAFNTSPSGATAHFL